VKRQRGSKMFITDTSGSKSLTATLAYVSFFVVMIKVLFSGASITVGSWAYEFGTIDALVIGAIFAPILGSYTARRWNSPLPEPEPVVESDPGSKPGDGHA
jgi:hypothetical protein